MPFQNKTIFITGASRGIGKAIALRLAAAGANIVIAAKSTEENPRLGGTIYTAAAEVEQAGGQALAVPCDIRFEEQLHAAVAQAVDRFGGIDVLVNNASAIQLTTAEQTEPKRYDLMQDINVRGTYMASQACIPHLRKAANPHILTLAPPINLAEKWFSKHTAYTVSKYAMSMVAFGLAAELRKDGIASNCLWPQTTIATAAVQNLLGGEALVKKSRLPTIVADAAFAILQKPSAACTGRFLIDEEVLRQEGVTDFEPYAVVPGSGLYPDLFL
jgi:citronellol/citronellal dehydrogenase